MFTPHKRRRRKKPVKPYASFPLTPHNNGQWCKKVRGKIHFFGVWEDHQAALANYLRVAADLHAGRQPSPVNLHPEGPTVKDACNHYLNCQFQKVQGGEIRPTSFEDCRQVAECLAKFLGSTRPVSDLTPTDFQQFRLHTSQHGLNGKSRGLGPYAQSRAITIVRSVFKHAYDGDLIDRPVKFGTGFERPPAVLVHRFSCPSPGVITCFSDVTYGSLRGVCSQLLSEADLAREPRLSEPVSTPSLEPPRQVRHAQRHLPGEARLCPHVGVGRRKP
jgi:hypothetical protein